MAIQYLGLVATHAAVPVGGDVAKFEAIFRKEHADVIVADSYGQL